jgi:hypothetical protein
MAALFIKGPLRLRYGLDTAAARDWDLTPLQLYVTVAPDVAQAVWLYAAPPYLLTIENLASFQRHVREVHDTVVLLYTGGFPKPALARFIGGLHAALPPHCPCFHCGDRDPRGLEIVGAVAAACRRHRVRPHLMDRPAQDSAHFTTDEDRRLRRIAGREDAVAMLARRSLDADLGRLEQEAVDPEAPAIARPSD